MRNRSRIVNTSEPFHNLELGKSTPRLSICGRGNPARRRNRAGRLGRSPDAGGQERSESLTGIYNVLDALRSGAALNAKEKQIHDDGLVTLLRQIHDEIDQAVLEAYGWSDLASSARDEAFEEALLTGLVALNHERAAEEKRGLVRWLRPEYQCPAAAASDPVAEQAEIDLPSAEISGAVRPVSVALTWPDKLPDQVAGIRALLPELGPDPAALSARFGRANQKRQDQIAAILETLRGLGL